MKTEARKGPELFPTACWRRGAPSPLFSPVLGTGTHQAGFFLSCRGLFILVLFVCLGFGLLFFFFLALLHVPVSPGLSQPVPPAPQ